jgi:hypothetical protein
MQVKFVLTGQAAIVINDLPYSPGSGDLPTAMA